MSFTNYRDPGEFFEDSDSSISTDSVYSDKEQIPIHTRPVIMDLDKLTNDMQELKEIVLTLATKINSLENRDNATGSNSIMTEDRNITSRMDPENDSTPQLAASTINFSEEEKISNFLWNEVKALPEFDNWSITVESFISQLEESINRIPRQYHSRFAKLIRAHKIRSNEKRLLEGYVTTQIEELIQVLRTQFGEFKTLDVVQTERNFCFQSLNEGILEYNKRFTTCQIAVERTVSNQSNLTPEHKRYTLINERQTGLNLYLRGLKESLRIMVTANRPATLKEAQDLALNEERTAYAAQLARRQALGINNIPTSRPTQPRQPQPRFTQPRIGSIRPPWNQETRIGGRPIYANANQPSRPIVPIPQPLKCYRCNGENHLARNCPNFREPSSMVRPPGNNHYIKYIESTQQQQPSSSSAYSIGPSGSWQTLVPESTLLKDDTPLDIELLKASGTSQG